MSIPPSSRRPSSTPASKGSPHDDDKKSSKNFKLPDRKNPIQAQEEKPKKKGLFDLTAEEMAVQSKQQGLHQELKVEQAVAAKSDAVEAQAQVSQVSQLVQKMVETMKIGQIDGQNFASLDLKKGAEVPPAFSGSNLTLSYQENGLKIHFDNFMTPQQQNEAVTLIEKNKEQLLSMVQALNAKNIQVTELSLGTHTVTLPRVEPLPPPFQAPSIDQSETRQQQGRGDREGGGQGREQGHPE